MALMRTPCYPVIRTWSPGSTVKAFSIISMCVLQRDDEHAGRSRESVFAVFVILCTVHDGHGRFSYIGSASFLAEVEGVVHRVRAQCDHLLYVCDPVLGDYDQGM